MKLDFKQNTRDSYVAYPTPGVSVVVSRDRSWRRLGQEKPWRVTEVFGDNFPAEDLWFAARTDAMECAEKIATEVVRSLAEAAGLVRTKKKP